MYNHIALEGRLTGDPEVSTTKKEGKERVIARYRLAVERNYKKDETRPVDFFTCKAFGSTAEYAETYLRKGDLVLVAGRLAEERYTEKESSIEKSFPCIHAQENHLLRKKAEHDFKEANMKPLPEEGLREQLSELPPIPEEAFEAYARMYGRESGN